MLLVQENSIHFRGNSGWWTQPPMLFSDGSF